MRKKNDTSNSNLDEVSKIIILSLFSIGLLSGFIYLFVELANIKKEKQISGPIKKNFVHSRTSEPDDGEEEGDETALENYEISPGGENYHSAKKSLRIKKKQDYKLVLIAENLKEPGGIATNPDIDYVYVAEESGNRVSLIYADGERVDAITSSTPIIHRDNENVFREKKPLKQPEGLCLSDAGYLYVTEDYPGGRLIRYELTPDGIAKHGTVIEIPGKWQHFAWEDINISPQGELLLVGSDAESIKTR